jgi:hypothetical protein
MSERLIQNLYELSDIQANPPIGPQTAAGNALNTQTDGAVAASILKYYEALQRLAKE